MSAWLETSGVATAIGQSAVLTGFLSAVHLLGMTLLVGGALVSSLRLLGVLLPDRPVPDVAAAAGRGIEVGLVVSLTSGLLLFSPRASSALGSGFFQLKMLLLVAAAGLHVVWYRRVIRRAHQRPFTLRIAGGLALVLWLGVASAGAAFILLE